MVPVTENDLRGLVRDAVARRLAEHGLAVPVSPKEPADSRAQFRSHASHVRFVLVTGRDQDGPCLIEPVTRCSHCGYCQSYGY